MYGPVKKNTLYEPVPLYTDQVPPRINQFWPILTQYHHVLTSTAFYWPSTTKYQPLPPSTDTVPSYINQYHFILTKYHKVSTVTTFYRPSTIIYQPVPLHTDPVPPSINQYQPILLLLGDYRLLHSLPWVLFFLSSFDHLVLRPFLLHRAYWWRFWLSDNKLCMERTFRCVGFECANCSNMSLKATCQLIL